MNNQKIREMTKNWPWKRIWLGAIVVSSVAASSSFGTYAYFTSSKEVATTFAAGKLEIGLGSATASFKSEEEQPFLPGVRFEKEITIENESDVPVKYAIFANKNSGDDVVYNQLMVEISGGGDDVGLLYKGKVNQLSEANVTIPNVEKGGHSALHFSVYLPESAGNEVQQKKAEVDFGFLATQLENGEYFAQKGPVITLSPAELSSDVKAKAYKSLDEKVDAATFILAEGTYHLSDLTSLPKNSTWKAEKGKEGKVIIQGEGSKLENVSLDGVTIKGGLEVGSHVSFVNCTFDDGGEAAIRTAETTGDEVLEGLTVRNSKFLASSNAIVLDQAIIGVVIDENTFEQTSHAVVVSDDKKSQVQIVNNDFSKIRDAAVLGGVNRIGDGIEGFKETSEDSDTVKLALHLRDADIYLENNQYPSR